MSKKQPHRRPASAKSSAATRAGKDAFAAMHAQGSHAVKRGTHAVHEFIATGADEAQKAQDKVLAIGREGAEKFARSADAAAKSMNEAIDISRGHIEACVECGNIAADMTRTISAEALNFANEMLTQNMEISKEAMACRTFSDLMELHSRAMQHNLDQIFSESNRFSELFFQYATEAAEPLKERVVEATERLSKVIAA